MKALGITNQRETVVVWDKTTGKPLHNAIVWQCRRTAEKCQELKQRGLEKLFKEKTGLPLDPYFSATKIAWILENCRGYNLNNLLWGTIDTWLVWKLTNGTVHVTDYSNASRTLLFNIHTLRWDDELLRILGVPPSMLPRVFSSSGTVGETSLFGEKIPLAGIAGDQQAALFGHCCFEKGMAKNTYGTGCFMLVNTGDKPVFANNGLLTTIAWGVDGTVEYALEGSVFIAGAVVQWLRDGLKIIDDAAQTNALALSVADTGGMYFVPAFVGLGTPYWDPHARGLMIGLTRGTTRAHIVRAALESIAYQTKDVIDAVQQCSGIPLRELKVDGGASQNDFLMQFQADMLGLPVQRSGMVEMTALGAAYLAGLGVGLWSKEQLITMRGRTKTFMPIMVTEEREKKYAQWKKAVERSLKWA